jgi:hypothetical protein
MLELVDGEKCKFEDVEDVLAMCRANRGGDRAGKV